MSMGRGWEDVFQSTWFRRALVILVILMVIAIATRGFFPWWVMFFVFPLFGNRRNHRADRDRREKRKNDDRAQDEMPFMDDEKPKRAAYRLGDDGELIPAAEWDAESSAADAPYIEDTPPSIAPSRHQRSGTNDQHTPYV